MSKFTNKLDIYIVTNEFVTDHRFAGGLSNYVYKIAKALLNYGHRPTIVYIHKDIISNFQIHEEIPVWNIKPVTLFPNWLNICIKRTIQFTKHYVNAVKWVEQLIYFLEQAYAVRCFLREKAKKSNIDIVHYTNLQGLGALHDKARPSIIRMSSFSDMWIPFGFHHTSKLERYFENRAIRRADLIISPSTFLVNYVSKYFKRDVAFVPTPFIESTLFLNDEMDILDQNRKYALYFGSLAEWKGIKILIEALKIYFTEVQDVDFVFIGNNNGTIDGKPVDQFIISNLIDFSSRFKILPAMRHEHLFVYLRNAEYVCLPSLVDNFPNTVLEAMFFKKCIISSAGVGIDDQICDQVNGFLVPPGDIKKLASKMKEVSCMTKNELELIGSRAFESLKRFSPDICCEMLINQYQEAIELQKSKIIL